MQRHQRHQRRLTAPLLIGFVGALLWATPAQAVSVTYEPGPAFQDEFAYYWDATAAPWLFRCASSNNMLSGTASTFQMHGLTTSRSNVFCVDLYPQSAGNNSVWPNLYKWTNGVPSLCVPGQQKWNVPNSAFSSSVSSNGTRLPCGPGLYSVTTSHIVYINGVPRGFFLNGDQLGL